MAYGYPTEENDPSDEYDQIELQRSIESQQGTSSAAATSIRLPQGMVLDKPAEAQTTAPEAYQPLERTSAGIKPTYQLPEGMVLDKPVAGADQAAPTEYQIPYSGALYPNIAQQRAKWVEEIESNPRLREYAAAAMSQEAGDDTAYLGALESLFNRTQQRGSKIAKQLTNGFYGPVNRGEVDRIVRKGVQPWMYEKFDKAFAAVKNGSDLIEGRTDQGMINEIVGPKAKYGSEYFGYMGGDPSWSMQHQRNKGQPGAATRGPSVSDKLIPLGEGRQGPDTSGALLPPGMVLDKPTEARQTVQVPEGMVIDEKGHGQPATRQQQPTDLPPSELPHVEEKPLPKVSATVALKFGLKKWIDQDTGMEVRRAELAGTPEESLPISSAIHKPKAGEPSLGINVPPTKAEAAMEEARGTSITSMPLEEDKATPTHSSPLRSGNVTPPWRAALPDQANRDIVVKLNDEGDYVPEWQRPLAKSPLRTGQNEWIDAANSFARGASSDGGMLSMFEGLYDIVGKTTKNIPGLKSISDNALKERGAVSAMRERVRKNLPVDKDFADSYGGQIASGLGQLTNLPIYVAAGAVGGTAGAAGAGVVMTVGQLWQEGKDDYKQTMEQQGKPYNEAEADKAATQYVVAAAPLEMLADRIIILKFLNNAAAKKLTIGKVLKEGADTFLKEGATEGAQQAWNNYVAKLGTGYDPNRPLTQGVVDSVVVGGAVGGIAGAVGTITQKGEQQQVKSEVPGTETASTAKEPTTSATADQITQTANSRINALRETRDGTPPQVTGMDAEGRPIYGEFGKAGRTLLKHEEEELAFLEKNIDDPKAIAKKYDIGLKEEPKAKEEAAAPEIQKKQDRIAEITKEIDKEYDPQKKAALLSEAMTLSVEVDKATKAQPPSKEAKAPSAPIEPTVETTSKPGRIVHKDGRRGEVVSEKDDTIEVEWDDDETTSTLKADEVKRSTSTTTKRKNTVSITSFGKRGMSVEHYDNDGKKAAQDQHTRGTQEESYADAKAQAEKIVKDNNLAGYYDPNGDFVRVGEQPKAKGEKTTVTAPEAAPGEWHAEGIDPSQQGLPAHMQEAFLNAQAAKQARHDKAVAMIDKATGIKGVVKRLGAKVTGKPVKTTSEIYGEQLKIWENIDERGAEATFRNKGLHARIEDALKTVGVPINYVSTKDNEGNPAAIHPTDITMDIAGGVWLPMIETARATGGEDAANRLVDFVVSEELIHASDIKAANEGYDALSSTEKKKLDFRAGIYGNQVGRKVTGRDQYKAERYTNIVKEAKRIAQAAPAKDGLAIAELFKNSYNAYRVAYTSDTSLARGYKGKPMDIFDFLIDPSTGLIHDVYGWIAIPEFLRQAKQMQLHNDITEATHASIYDKIGKMFKQILNGVKRGLKNIIGTGKLPLLDKTLADIDRVLAGDPVVDKQSSIQSILYGSQAFTDHVASTTITIGPDGKHQALYAFGAPAFGDGLGFRFMPEKRARRVADNATANGEHIGYAPMPVWVRAEKPAMVNLSAIMQQQGTHVTGWNPTSLSQELLRNNYVSPEDLGKIVARDGQITNTALKQLLQDYGYDSIAFKHSEGTHTVIVFEKEQIASATGNEGVHSIDNVVHTKPPQVDAFETEVVRLHNANGGSSYNAVFGDMGGTDYYAVGSFPELSVSVKGKEILRQDIIDIRDRALAQGIDLNTKHIVIGTWFNEETGWTDIDISAMIPDLHTALEIAEQHQQTAIFDLATFATVNTNGAFPMLGGLPSLSERNGFIAAKAAKPIEFLKDEDELTTIAKENAQYKDWYTRFAKYMRDVFLKDYPEYIPLINYFLGATSPHNLVAANFTRMVSALRNFVETGDPAISTEGKMFMEGHYPNLRRSVKLDPETGKPVDVFENLSGLKVSEYTPALFGDPTAMAIDMHVANILFGTQAPTDAQREEAMRMIMRIAKRLKWSYAEVQAAFFAADLVAGRTDPETGKIIPGKKVDHYERTAELRKAEVYKLLDADRKAGGLGAKISASLLERTRTRTGVERLLGDNVRAKQQIIRAREVAIDEYVASTISLRGPPQRKAAAKGPPPNRVDINNVSKDGAYMMDPSGNIYSVRGTASGTMEDYGTHESYASKYLGGSIHEALRDGWLKIITDPYDSNVYWKGPAASASQQKALGDIGAITGFQVQRDRGGGKVGAKAPASTAGGHDIRLASGPKGFLGQFYNGIKHVFWASRGLAGLGNMIHKHIDLRARLAAEQLYPITKWLGDIKVAGVNFARPVIKAALNEHQEWRQNKAAGLPTGSLSPKAKEIKNIIDGLMGNINKRNAAGGVKIRNPDGKSVSIPHIEYPAILQEKYLDAMREPHKHQSEWNELVAGLKAEHIIPMNAADAMARNHIEKFLKSYDSNGSFGSFFFFNKMIPKMAHDFSLGGFQKFTQEWVDKVSLAESFGPNPDSDLFEFVISKATSKDVKDYVRRAKNLAYGDTVNSPAGRFASAVGGWASIQHLANWATAVKDLISGQIFNVHALGLRNYINGFWNQVAHPFQSINDEMEQGILLNDLMHIMTDGEMIGGVREQVGKTAMSVSFRNLVETWNRGIAYQGGKSLLRHAIYAYEKNPRSPKTLQYMAALRKLGFRDGREELILQEGGKGDLAGEYLRSQVNAIQAGYTYADVPAFVSEPAGKWFLKYSPWSIEHMRYFVNNVLVQTGRGIGLAPKDKVTVIDPTTGKKETRVVPRRPLDAGQLVWYLLLTTAAGQGEEWLLEMFFRMHPKTARWTDIFDRFKREDPRAWNELGTKLWQINMLAGTAGYLGNLVQHGLVFAGLQEGRGNDKGILGVIENMPGLDPVKKLYDFIAIAFEKKAITGKDALDLANAVSMFRVTSQTASSVANDVFGADYWASKMVSAKQDISRVKNIHDRWIEDIGKDKAAKMIGFERMEKTEKSVWREPLDAALMTGDLTWAKQILTDVKRSMTPQQWEAEKDKLKQSIKAKQPIEGSEAAHYEFMKWAKRTQTPYDYELIRRADDTYRKTATRLNLDITFKPPSVEDRIEFNKNIKMQQQQPRSPYPWAPWKF